MRQLKIATQITNRDSQAVEKYLQEISKISMITPEEETTLAQKIHMGDQRALEKREAPDGLWHKCPECKTTNTVKELQDNLYVCHKCNYHNRINAAEYFSILFDDHEGELLFENIAPKDELGFVDLKPYDKRLVEAQKNTGLLDAMTVGVGEIEGSRIVIACMNFNFIGGSMGSVVGEKISRGIDYAIENALPFMIISKSGGARMMESAFSLMQMAKNICQAYPIG